MQNVIMLPSIPRHLNRVPWPWRASGVFKRKLAGFGLSPARTLALSLFAVTRLVAHAEPLLDLDAAALARGVLNARVESVQGRAALVFNGVEEFIAEAPLPAGFEKGKPFTVEAWALNPAVGKAETVVAFAPARGGPGTEFGFGSGPTAGAFRSGFKATTPFAAPPSPEAWHHLAWTFAGGAEGMLRVYVDGELDIEKPLRLTLPPGAKIHVGASGEVDGNGPKKGFSGAIAQVRVHDAALTQEDLRRSAGIVRAFAPTPRNGETLDALQASLRWQRGSADTASFVVFAGPDRAAVERGDGNLAKPTTGPEFGPVTLGLGQTYFWRVDGLDKSGRVVAPGVVWTFTAEAGLATGPQPRDQNSNVAPGVRELAWQPGKYATKQTVFLATSPAELGTSAPLASVAAPAARCALPSPLASGTRYFWRVDSENGAQPPSRGRVWTFRTQDAPIQNDVTFFVGSDCHYGRENNAAINRRVIDEMNALPGTPLPASMGGGFVRTPRGVVLNGDLLDEGFNKETAPANWAEFCRDYGLTGNDGRLCFPVYEGFGNHDGGPAKSFVRAGIKERNPMRVGLKSISENGLHYSWDWDQLHLVNLNLFGGSGPADVKGVNAAEHDPEQSLEFLKYDLAQNVGASGHPVITFQHFAWLGGMSDWWQAEAKERFYEVIEPYKIACLINGHSHGADFVPWHDLLTVHDGSTARGESDTGDFLVVRVTEKEVLIIQRKLGGWGNFRRKPFAAPASATP